MKTLLVYASFCLATLAQAACPLNGMPVGFHEFGIFGGAKHVFISHYPAFSSIHAYQVLLEVALSADDHDAQSKFLEHLAAHPGVSYTYSPYRKAPVTAPRAKDQDDWVLTDKAHAGQEINGDIHYRENGQDVTLDQNVSAKVVRVIESRLLLPDVARPKKLTYHLFGDSKGWFLAHYLSAPPNPGEQVPDFDQILAISTGSNPPRGVYTVAERSNDQKSRLTNGDSATLVDRQGGKVDVKVLSEIFVHQVSTER